MKRVLSLIFGVMLGAMLLAPFGDIAGSTPLSVNTAQAGCAVNSSGQCSNGPVVSVPKCINIALKIFSSDNTCVDNDPAKGGAIVVYLRLILKLLSGAVGLVIVLMLVIAGVQYITSLGDPGRIKNAKERIVNAITGLVLYLMMFAILNFIIPGGIL